MNENYENLAVKIDSEGGLAEYIISYAGRKCFDNEPFAEETRKFVDAYDRLVEAMETAGFEFL